MKRVNNTQLMEVMFDMLSDNSINFRAFATAFFQSRVKNKESFYNTIDLLKNDIKEIKVQDSKDLHTDMIKEFCE